MSHRIGNIDVEFVESDKTFHNWWSHFKPSTRILPKGWQREPGRLALREDLIWDKDVPIPLRDGVNALSGLDKFEAPDPAEWCPRGYAMVQVDARGCYDSEGDIFVFGTQEGRDAYDTIEWIAKQPWSNGSVGLVGNSWLAITQWFIAAEQPPHLKAIVPWEGIGDFYRESICRGGIPSPHFWDFLAKTFNGKNSREDVGAMIRKYPLMNEYWADKKPQLSKIEVPMYVLASYSTGLHLEGSIRGWKYASSKNKWLRIHPTQEWHDLYQLDANDDLQRFLDRYLLGHNNGWDSTPNVRLSLIRYNRPPISFRSEDTWPPSRVQYETLILNAADGSMQENEVEIAESVSYDSTSWDDDGAHFVYRFGQYTELVGFSKAVLFMSCDDLDDMDVYVMIRKLDRDGNPLVGLNILMAHQKRGTLESDIRDENLYKYLGPHGCLRASKRRVAPEPGLTEDLSKSVTPTELWYPHDKSEKVKPGDIVRMEVAIWPGGMVFEEGESLRFEVKGHNPVLPEFPALHRTLTNLNQGRHVLHTGAAHQSHVVLPLIRR
ncbi:alpha/beta-hydrolase [Lophiostoma macrostomum CBS 122681]|uniref:Alpha/beta-hydrolase n=1 Tax=Lophiostoma macrostomum CBS 122681 TaxID=1314788 RepID=A0A6A6T6K5_9PLEO|nr:alpha/beta-hydrolase [Lophiostoma macrostomum CBS 122681]